MRTVVVDRHPLGFRLMARSLAEGNTTAFLPGIDVPTLLLWGDQDLRSPMGVGERFRDAIPGSELEVVVGAGHVSNMEQPQAFNDHVRRFCSAHTPSG
jgi:pimeloyl-ACP methyl ester carboxylesterase